MKSYLAYRTRVNCEHICGVISLHFGSNSHPFTKEFAAGLRSVIQALNEYSGHIDILIEPEQFEYAFGDNISKNLEITRTGFSGCTKSINFADYLDFSKNYAPSYIWMGGRK